MSDTSKFLTLTEAAERCPRPIHPRSVWRWARHGVRSRGGGRVHLRHIRQGRTILTRADWLQDFMQDAAESDRAHFTPSESAAPSPEPEPGSRTPEERARAVAAARAELARDA